MDFGLHENDNGEYVVLNDVPMADICLASLVYFCCLCLQVLHAYCTFASKQAVSITLLRPSRNNKSFTTISVCDSYMYTAGGEMYGVVTGAAKWARKRNLGPST